MVVLPAPLGPSKPEALALLDLQVDPVDGVDRAVSPGILLAQVLDANRPFPHALVASLAHGREASCAFRPCSGDQRLRSRFRPARWRTWG